MDPVSGENNFDLDESLKALEAMPNCLRALLAPLPDSWTEFSEDEQAWSPHSVLIHFIHTEQDNWLLRTRVILSEQTERTFAPFIQMPENSELSSLDIAQLLDRFAKLREENLAEVRAFAITPEDLDREGIHPTLGTVNLRQLISTWVVHDYNHLHQIAKTLAKHYGNDVGPWRVHLGILDL